MIKTIFENLPFYRQMEINFVILEMMCLTFTKVSSIGQQEKFDTL